MRYSQKLGRLHGDAGCCTLKKEVGKNSESQCDTGSDTGGSFIHYAMASSGKSNAALSTVR